MDAAIPSGLAIESAGCMCGERNIGTLILRLHPPKAFQYSRCSTNVIPVSYGGMHVCFWAAEAIYTPITAAADS